MFSRHVWLILFLSLVCSDWAWAGLIIDSQALQTRVDVHSQVTDASFITHTGPGTVVITTPAPTTLTLGPFTSSVSDTSGDSAYAHVESFSYSYSSSMIASSGSVAASVTLGQGRNLANGLAGVEFNGTGAGFLTVDHATPFTLTSSFSKTVQSSLVITAGVLLADINGNYLVNRAFSTTVPGSQTFTDSGILLPGVQYVLSGNAEANDTVFAPHSSTISDDSTFSFVLTVPEPSTIVLAALGVLGLAAYARRRARYSER